LKEVQIQTFLICKSHKKFTWELYLSEDSTQNW